MEFPAAKKIAKEVLGKSQRGLANGGLAQNVPIRPKSAFEGNICTSPVAVRCRGIGSDWPRSPDKRWKDPNQHQISLEDFCPIVSESLAFKPPLVSPH